ncbi:MAG TPA: MFS transporter [Patescibacteria group bacterium]|nr:MFS transporter [Patescibacteria group bacterium]
MSEQRKGPGKAGAGTAFRFVLLLGIVSFFADFAYEGARSVTGPFLAVLGASGAVVGVVAGLGELLGYGLRLVSGPLSDRTKKFWPIAIFGYVIQMASVPLLALAGSWPMAALLILTERMGKAVRNPPRDVMLSHASQEIGLGLGFGIHEAMDQAGAMLGPLAVAGILYWRGDYRHAFAMLLVPALLTLAILLAARLLYPKPEHLESQKPAAREGGFSRLFWVYLAGAALVAAGFADFQLIAFHFQKAEAFPNLWIPIIYSIAMAVSGAGSLIFGRLYDRFGIGVLIPLTLVSALFAPLVFLGGFRAAVVGAGLWGLGMGVHESIIPAAVAPMVPAERRSSAYGLFTAAYGIAWFLGSAAMGVLYDISIPAVVIFSVALELAALPIFIRVRSLSRRQAQGL